MIAQRPEVDRLARQGLESRFDLTCKPSPTVKMSRGKPVAIGPSAIAPKGEALTHQNEAAMRAAQDSAPGGASPGGTAPSDRTDPSAPMT